MSDQITTAFVRQFGAEVEMLVQQRGSRLRRAVMVETGIVGESKFFEQVGAIPDGDVAVNLPRHSDSPLMETPHARRRVTMKNFEWGDLIDDFDKVQTLIDPTNPYTQNAGWAIGRQVDLEIISKFTGSAFTGKEGTVEVTFDTDTTVGNQGNRVPVDFDGDSADEGMTVQKLREARRFLLSNEAWPEGEPAFVAMSSKQMDDLLGTTEYTSADFNTVRALVNGEVNQFLGFEFIRTELLAYSDAPTNTIRRCPVWVRSGMKLGVGIEPKSRIAERADKRFSTYVYWSGRFGATRMQEPKVLEILAKE